MRYYIVDCNGDVYADFDNRVDAEGKLAEMDQQEVVEKEIEIIEGI